MLLPETSPVKHRRFTVRRVARTGSTQQLVREAARSGAPDGYCVVAAEQTRGRGRQGRTWFAPPGSALLTSVLLRLPQPVLAGLPFAAGLAAVDTVACTTAVRPQLKWPNDVMVEEAKLAGILVEVEGAPDGEGRVAAVVGLGLNRTVDEVPAPARATSLHRLVASPPSLDALLQAWLRALDRRAAALEAFGVGQTIDAWRAACTGLGGHVSAVQGEVTISGVAEDIEPDGALRIRDDAGAVHRVSAADVHLG
jgi:BirA family transcriptional regulator, biotin operon repressor / biotin---[acetyl-CoA-carboxylase] ligase